MSASTEISEPVRAPGPTAYLVDLVLYLALVFGIRELYFAPIGFIANVLTMSLVTLAFATWRMRVRGVSWRDLGLRRPASVKITLIATAVTLGLAIGSIIGFEMLKDILELEVAPDRSDETAVSKFGDLKGNWLLFLAIIPFVWLQSMFEELLDRGFMLVWIERTLGGTLVATILAVITQAAIFGFRHSYDLSERSITVGLIGLAMGIGYVAFGRNLWPLIIAHCVLNTLSMAGRVT